MRVDRGYFFVPAIDIGLVYSPGRRKKKKNALVNMDSRLPL